MIATSAHLLQRVYAFLWTMLQEQQSCAAPATKVVTVDVSADERETQVTQNTMPGVCNMPLTLLLPSSRPKMS